MVEAMRQSKVGDNNPRLAHYADVVLRTAAVSAPTPEISALDQENLPILVDAYNKRYPNLNLECFDDAKSFLTRLWLSDAPSWRGLVKLHDSSSHRVAADVRTHHGGIKTLLILESALAHGLDPNNHQPRVTAGLESLHTNVVTYFQDRRALSVIELGAQKAMIGCMAFALDIALNACHKADFLDGLHARLHDTGRCCSDDDDKAEVLRGMEIVDGRKVLPAAFYKHAQSRATIDNVIKYQPELVGHDARANSSAPAETLRERVQAFRINRGDISYSMSIEASRMRKIRNAIENT